jgi:hypothetical protein
VNSPQKNFNSIIPIENRSVEIHAENRLNYNEMGAANQLLCGEAAWRV